VGKAKLAQLKAAFEIARRFDAQPIKKQNYKQNFTKAGNNLY